MSREKQIIEIKECIDSVYGADCAYFDVDGFAIANKIYDAGYRKQEWISVDERLPEDGIWVLGYSAKSGRGGLCNCLKSYVREFGNYDDTTHWLPLPEFPKTKGE